MRDTRTIQLGATTRRVSVTIVLVGAILSTSRSRAQNFPTTVQLPTFSSFSVQTSVSIPDSGGAYKDALRRRTYGQTRPYSPLNPRLRTSVAPRAGVTARDPVDSLNLNANRGAAGDYETASRDQVVATPAATLRAQQRAAKKQEDAIKKSLADGRAAAARGRFGTARVYFTYAERRASGSLKEFALAELKLLEAQELAQRSSVTSR